MDMFRAVCISLCPIALLLLLADAANAFPRRRARRYNYTYYYSSGWKRVASKRDSASADLRSLSVYCDYERAQSDEVAFEDRIQMFLSIWDEEILNTEDRLVAEVKIADVADSQTTHVRYVPVTLSKVDGENCQLGTLEISNDFEEEPIIDPGRVYRLFLNLHREAAEYDERSAWGRLPGPYYVATSGPTPLQRARQRIVMRTFREWYYTERGWNRNARYPMDCHAYYRWATGRVTKGATDGWANLGELFTGDTPYVSGGHISSLMKQGPIHGDYVRMPGHTFMLLAHDAQEGHVWTMEANFNGTIEIVLRSVDTNWTVGHLESEHLHPDLCQPDEPPASNAAEMMAQLDKDGSAVSTATP